MSLVVILCEGEHDAWFFKEIMGKNFSNDQIYTILDNRMDKLQKILGENFSYIRTKYSLIIYGDNGRDPLIEKVLPRVMVDTLGKITVNIYLLLIVDDDGVGYDKLKISVSDKLSSISRDRSKFNPLPELNQNGERFILRHPRTQGYIEVIFRNVPGSLEGQIVRKAIEIKYPNEIRTLQKYGPDRTFDHLASKYYGDDKKSLIRESVNWLENEKWIQSILELFST